MGIGREAARTLIGVLKAQTTDKQGLRDALGEAINTLQSKTSAMDAQLNGAAADFAASKPGQFAAHVAALPDVGDPAP